VKSSWLSVGGIESVACGKGRHRRYGCGCGRGRVNLPLGKDCNIVTLWVNGLAALIAVIVMVSVSVSVVASFCGMAIIKQTYDSSTTLDLAPSRLLRFALLSNTTTTKMA